MNESFAHTLSFLAVSAEETLEPDTELRQQFLRYWE